MFNFDWLKLDWLTKFIPETDTEKQDYIVKLIAELVLLIIALKLLQSFRLQKLATQHIYVMFKRSTLSFALDFLVAKALHYETSLHSKGIFQLSAFSDPAISSQGHTKLVIN